ncbi:hypothetical protein [Ralstonia sp. ASV6]|uniref:hypothetical protein n=1 Tax=Ralstonia sp. ASV6 TaxID=2795124 RepID=UPI0018EE3EC5|nr:hypothetical protein [Ralstonia sp. ASV6]
MSVTGGATLLTGPTATRAHDFAKAATSTARLLHRLRVRLVVPTIPAGVGNHARVRTTPTATSTAPFAVASASRAANAAVTTTRLTTSVHRKGTEVMDQLVVMGVLQ